jgi:hypothetical protein
MKTILIMLILSSSCFADEFNFREYYKWTDADTNREVAFQVLNVIDWRQTVYIARNPDRYYEINPLFASEYPSEGEVNWHFAANALLHPLVSIALAPPYRSYWQYFTVGFTGAAVANNARIGIKIAF